METMRVVTQTEYGGPEVLVVQRRDIPDVPPTQIRVRVQAAGVNPVDWKTRAGHGIAGLLGGPPFVLGWDVAGVVDQVGYGVTRFAVGDRVVGMPLFPSAAGAYGEYVVAPSRQWAHAPQRASVFEAAGLPLAGLTAWQALVDTAGIGSQSSVLIHAAAGGVGHLAVQIARARGCYVVGTARSEKHALLAGLGVHETVDVRTTQPQVTDVDVVLDLIGDAESAALVDLCRPGGWYIGVPSGVPREAAARAARREVRTSAILVEPDGHALGELVSLVDAGRLRVLVEEVFPLADAADAHRHGERGRTVGKLVLDVTS